MKKLVSLLLCLMMALSSFAVADEITVTGKVTEIEKYGLHLFGVVPHDDAVYEYDAEGKPSVTVPADSPVKKAVHAIFDQLSL